MLNVGQFFTEQGFVWFKKLCSVPASCHQPTSHLFSMCMFVIAWAPGQLRINFTSIFKVFTRDESDLENVENTSEINPQYSIARGLIAITCV